MRYSEEELAEFGSLIELQIQIAEKDVAYYKDILKGNPNGTDDTGGTFKILEEANNVASKEEARLHLERVNKHLNNLNSAKIRVENKTYGVCNCKMCMGEKLISKYRLSASPVATTCIKAKTR